MKQYFNFSKATIGTLLVVHSVLNKVAIGGTGGVAVSGMAFEDRNITIAISVISFALLLVKEAIFSIIKYADPESLNVAKPDER